MDYRNPFEETQQFETKTVKRLLIFLIVSAMTFVSIWTFIAYKNYQPNIFTTAAVKFEDSSLYDSVAGSIRLKGVDVAGSCNVFISDPSMEMQLYGNYSCSQLGSVQLSKADFLKGINSIMVFSEKTKRGYDETLEIK